VSAAPKFTPGRIDSTSNRPSPNSGRPVCPAYVLFALEQIAAADHPDSPLSRGPCTEHEFSERLMQVARAALAKVDA
jgi:hypothetical protein